MVDAAPSPVQACCPRCGYDQRGVMALWTESCPLTGLCSECGLEFSWPDVLVPHKFAPQWCVEFVPRFRRVPQACINTLLRSLWPWRFWSRWKMSQPIRWGRLAAYLLILTIGLMFTTAIAVQVTLALVVRHHVNQSLNAQSQLWSQQLARLQIVAVQLQSNPDAGGVPGRVQLDPQGVQTRIAQLQAITATSSYIDKSALMTTLEAIISPLAQRSSATIVMGPMSQPYVAPRNLFTYALGQSSVEWDEREAHVFLAWIVWGLAMTVALPLSFALLPFTMRRAKVRWKHIARVTIYSAVIPMLVLVTAALLVGYVFLDGAFQSAAMQIAKYAPWLAIALFWHAATGRYLKIPHAWLTIGMLTLMCLLAFLGITAAIDHHLAWEMMDLFGPFMT